MNRKIVSIFLCKLMLVATVISVAATGMINDTTNQSPPELEWDIKCGSDKIDWGCNVQQTYDGGYIISGTCDRFPYTPWQGYGYLLKIDDQGNEEWNQIFSVYNWEVVCQSVQQIDDDGDGEKDDGYIIAGYTGYTWEIDLFIAKTDVNGDVLWTKVIGETESFDRGNSVSQTKDGGYIVTGCTQSYGAEGADVWLMKIDTEGNEVWSKTIGGESYDSGNCVQQTSEGGYIIAGETDSFGINGDSYLVKTDSSGEEEWSKTFGGNGWDGSYSVQQTMDKGYIITGWYTTNTGDHDVYLIKTDENGQEEWSKTFGDSLDDEGYSVQQTAYEGYFITGFTSTDSIEWFPEIYLIKTDSSGEEEWTKTLSKEEQNVGYYGKQTKDGGYIITGYTGNYSNESLDIWIIKLEGNNQIPDVPSIDGPSNVRVNRKTEYSIVTNDPNQDIVSYYVDWGDGTTDEWTDFSKSGTEVFLKHTWKKQGAYMVKVKAKDPYNAESDWCEIQLEVAKNANFAQSLLLRLLERFPNVYLVLRALLILLGR